MMTTRSNTDEIADAEAQVQERKGELSRSLREAEDSGKHLVQRVRQELKPAMQAALVVAGAVTVVGIAVVVATRGRRSSSAWLGASRPSTARVLAKSAGLWALRMLARRAAQELVSRLNEPPAARASALPHP